MPSVALSIISTSLGNVTTLRYKTNNNMLTLHGYVDHAMEEDKDKDKDV